MLQKVNFNQALWICGARRIQEVFYPRLEVAALRERGAQVFLLDEEKGDEGLNELRRILHKSDIHLVLMWLRPREAMLLYPLLRERKNYSIVMDDWWIYPDCLTRNADYLINRMYNGVAVRLGVSELVTMSPPLFFWPVGKIGGYGLQAALLRLPTLLVWPFIDAWKRFLRQRVKIDPRRLLYLPFSVSPESLPLKGEEIKYDFTLTGGVTGVWLMRDAYASFKHTFANLYYDRQRLMDLMIQHEGKPFHIYDWRGRGGVSIPPNFQSWDDYCRVTRESRYVVATGGFHNAGLPKHLEYTCLGTPMIGRTTVFEYPWLDDCLIDVDVMNLTSAQIKPILKEAMERYPVMRQNCLKWREQIFRLYNIHTLFDMLQAQANGQPIPSDYLRKGVKTPHHIKA